MAIRTVFGNRDGREKKTLANKEYYRTLIDSKKEATFLADTSGDLFLLNNKAQLLTGYSEEEIREYHVKDIFVSLRTFENPFDAGQYSEFTSKLYLIDSRHYLLPVTVDFKEIEGRKFLCTCVEIAETEIQAGQVEIISQLSVESSPVKQQTAANELQIRWPAEFEQQLRTLLNNLLGFSSILARDSSISDDKKLSGTLDSLMKSGTQLKNLFNRISTGESDSHEVTKTPCSLSSILQKASILLDPLVRQNNLEIHLNLKEEISVFSDAVLLLELIQYLLEKALLYTRNEEVLVDVVSDSPGGKGIISIDNLGQDIPQAVINFLKRENGRNDYDLGNPLIAQNPEIRSMLSILNRIDGKITFTTGPAMGEIAQVTLPLASATENIDDLTMLENSIRSKKLNILIVEDEKFTARILTIYLEEVSAVSLAFSGNEALNITEINYNKGIIFNAVIMDIGLPKPWDGILLKREMEKRWPEYQNVPFLAQTAFTAKSYSDRIAQNNFKGYLLKPVNRIDVLRFLEKFCKQDR